MCACCAGLHTSWFLGHIQWVAYCRCSSQSTKGQFCLLKKSGHFLSSKLFAVETKLHTAAALVDSTLLHGGQLWLGLPPYIAGRMEAIHMRWLRKATSSYRSQAEDRVSDHDLRVTYDVPSVWALLRGQRLRYLATFMKASPFYVLCSSMKVGSLRGCGSSRKILRNCKHHLVNCKGFLLPHSALMPGLVLPLVLQTVGGNL